MFSQEPPPPRFVMNVNTGKWKKQVVTLKPRPRTSVQHIQNSLDHVLHHAMYFSKPKQNSDGKGQRAPVDVAKQIEAFELRRQGGLRRLNSISPSAHLNTNPICGLLCGVPLYDIFDAFAQIKKDEFEQLELQQQRQPREQQESEQQEQAMACEEWPSVRITVNDLYVVCSALVRVLVSESYLRSMFYMLPTYQEDETVEFSSFFSFLVEQAFHPELDRNVDALFSAFDPNKTGLISAATLTAPVFLAFAELNLFGNLRGEWERMAATLEVTNGVDLRVVNNVRLLTPAATRAVFCASKVLYRAIEAVDLDGSHLKRTP
ncbi:hypothetical protein TRVL_02474 [Trypanosoma vivax]|nr:hypothetical protein TRVL_02474 [Trypanosoma vivax]